MFPISLRSKRAKLALRFFTYGVMTLATVVLTTLAIFYALGYRFNQSTLTFEQGGLVQFRSTPADATVVIDGKQQNFRTPGRTHLSAGIHTIVMQKQGYSEWSRTVSIAPGQLLWLNYTRMVPSSITTVPLKTFTDITKVLPAPDHRWMLVQEKADSPTFTLADFGDEDNPIYTSITVPETKLTKTDGKYGQFTLLEWSLSSRYVLVRHQNGPVNEWLRVDRANPAETVNISQIFRLNIVDAHISGINPNFIFAKTDDVLRRLDIGNSSASAALVTGVQYFHIYGDDTISYIAMREAIPGDENSKQQVVGIFKNDKEVTIQTHDPETKLMLAYSEYDNHSYLAIHKGEGSVQVLRDAHTGSSTMATFAAFSVGKAADWLDFSDNGRMVVATAGSTLATHDLELGKTYKSEQPYMNTANGRHMRWLDDYHLWSDAGSTLRFVDFDGINENDITAVAPGFDVALSNSGETLYSVGKNAVTGEYFLQASKLVVE